MCNPLSPLCNLSPQCHTETLLGSSFQATRSRSHPSCDPTRTTKKWASHRVEALVLESTSEGCACTISVLGMNTAIDYWRKLPGIVRYRGSWRPDDATELKLVQAIRLARRRGEAIREANAIQYSGACAECQGNPISSGPNHGPFIGHLRELGWSLARPSLQPTPAKTWRRSFCSP